MDLVVGPFTRLYTQRKLQCDRLVRCEEAQTIQASKRIAEEAPSCSTLELLLLNLFVFPLLHCINCFCIWQFFTSCCCFIFIASSTLDTIFFNQNQLLLLFFFNLNLKDLVGKQTLMCLLVIQASTRSQMCNNGGVDGN